MTDKVRLTRDGKVKRSCIRNQLAYDVIYDRASKHGKTLQDIQHYFPKYYVEQGLDRYTDQKRAWESINHLEEEMSYYESRFNSLVMDKNVEKAGEIHVDGNCFCLDCIIISKFKKERWKTIQRDQLIVRDDVHYVRIGDNTVPVNRYFKTLF